MTPPFVRRYLIALEQHKLIALGTFALVVGVSGVVALQVSPPPTSYKAVGVLADNSPPTEFSSLGTQIQQQGRQWNEDILLSDYVVQTAAPQAQISPEELRSRVQLKLPKASSDNKSGKDSPPESNTIQVTYLDVDKQRSEATLRALMQAMVNQSLTLNTARLKATIKALSDRLSPVKQELQVAEQILERYNRTQGPALLAAQDSTLVGAITGAEEQQRQLVIQIQAVDTQMRSLEGKLGLNPDQAYTSSALSSDPIIANLRSQILQNETQLQILSRDLRPEHPTMIDLIRKQQTYEQLLRQRAAEVIGGGGVAQSLDASRVRQDSNLDPARQQLANQLVSLQTQRDTLIQQLNSTGTNEQELRRQYAQLPNKQLEQARLQQQVALKKALFDKIQASLVDAQAAEAETVSSLSIAKQPEAKQEVVQPPPSPLLIIAGGAFIGLFAAGGLIFLLSSLDSKLHTLEDVRAALQERDVLLLGELPWVSILDPDLGETPVLINADSPYIEFYERFRSNLRRVSEKPLKVVLLTSTEFEEGKTVSAYNLAIASALAGKRTLLVEADLRSPSQAKYLKMAPDPDASIEPLHYYGSRNECIRLVPDVENLYIVPSAGPQRQAAGIVESNEMQRLLDDARGRFDLVVVDTPALSRCNDALLLEPYTDGLVLVTRPGYTQGNMLAEAIDELTETEVPLLGAIISAVDLPVPRLPSHNLKTELEEEYVTEPIRQ